MKSCWGYKELLLAELHGTLDDEQRQHLQEHLSRCSVCSLERERLQSLMNEIYSVSTPPEPKPEDIQETVNHLRSRLKRKGFHRAWRHFDLSPKGVIIPLAAAALLLLALGLIDNFGTDNSQLAEQSEYTERLQSEDIKVLENMELLENMEVIQRLVTITDESSSQGSSQNNNGQKERRGGNVYHAQA